MWKPGGAQTDPGILILEANNVADVHKKFDAYGNQFRFGDILGTEYAHLGPTWLRTVGYMRVGSLTTPTNTTAGDATAVRLSVGVDGAFSTNAGSLVRFSQVITSPGAGANVLFNALQTLTPGGDTSSEFRALNLQNVIPATAHTNFTRPLPPAPF